MATPAEEVTIGYNDAEGVNNSPRSTYIYKDLSLFFTPNPVSGDVTMVTDVQDIKRSVRNLVLTNRFEKPFHPEIASHVRDLLFQPFTVITYNLLKDRIEKVIELYEPRATVTRIVVDDRKFQNMDNNTLSVKIFFYMNNAPTNEEEVDIMLERIR